MIKLSKHWHTLQQKKLSSMNHPWFFEDACALPLDRHTHPDVISSEVLFHNENKFFPPFLEKQGERPERFYCFNSLVQEKRERVLIFFYMDKNQEKMSEALEKLKELAPQIRTQLPLELFFAFEANELEKSFVPFVSQIKKILPKETYRFISNYEFMTMGPKLRDYEFYDLTFASRLYHAWIYHYVLGHGGDVPQAQGTVSKDSYKQVGRQKISPFHVLELYEVR